MLQFCQKRITFFKKRTDFSQPLHTILKHLMHNILCIAHNSIYISYLFHSPSKHIQHIYRDCSQINLQDLTCSLLLKLCGVRQTHFICWFSLIWLLRMEILFSRVTNVLAHPQRRIKNRTFLPFLKIFSVGGTTEEYCSHYKNLCGINPTLILLFYFK